MVVQSFGQLASLTPPTPTWQYSGGAGSVDLYGNALETYYQIWRKQPNVRTCVDFLARNVAHLGLHVFRRDGDSDRVRLTDHELAQWLEHPNPWTTRYRLIETLMIDLGIYMNAFWLKVRTTDPRLSLVRLPPQTVRVLGGLQPTGFVVTSGRGEERAFGPDDLVHFGGYGDELTGVSPLETLRRILAEENAAGDYRQSMWQNAARVEGVIERPATAKAWQKEQKQSFREQWQQAYGAGGTRVGSVAVLEDGMTFKPISFSAKELEFISARKLTREECAAAYHIPLPMVGILEHATFSNIVEQHKNLYQDTLGPWLEMIQSEIERQVLPEALAPARVYVEFNIAEKLKGSFEQQAASLQLLTGRPVMTGNEGRARLNLPRIDDDPSMDTVAAQQGGPAASADVQAPADRQQARQQAVAKTVRAHLDRQAKALAKLTSPEARLAAFDHDRWRQELATDLAPVLGDATLALVYATRVTDHTFIQLMRGADAFTPTREVLLV